MTEKKVLFDVIQWYMLIVRCVHLEDLAAVQPIVVPFVSALFALSQPVLGVHVGFMEHQHIGLVLMYQGMIGTAHSDLLGMGNVYNVY